MTQAAASTRQAGRDVRTLGVVSFLNALPLHATLQGRDDVVVVPGVPSRLGEMLAEGRCDVALLPIVDFWHGRDRLALVSDGCIASNGETLTVRVFSRIPPDRVTRLHVDGDSHTSVVLAQLVWLELYARRLELVPFENGCLGAAAADTGVGAVDDAEAVLLIGDKVVRHVPRGFGFEVDLGAAWKHLTKLPFVFAAWYGPNDRDIAAIAPMLQSARDAGVADIKRIADAHAEQHGWPPDAARRYLGQIMRYTLTDPMRQAMDRFFDLAVKHGLLK